MKRVLLGILGAIDSFRDMSSNGTALCDVFRIIFTNEMLSTRCNLQAADSLTLQLLAAHRHLQEAVSRGVPFIECARLEHLMMPAKNLAWQTISFSHC